MSIVTFSGWQLKARIASTLNGVTGSSLSGTSLDTVTKISYDYSNNVSLVGQVGERANTDIIDGKIAISGTVERFYTGSGMVGFGRGTNETGSLTKYAIGIYPNGDVSGQPYFAFWPVKFNGPRGGAKAGASLQTEIFDFLACRMYTGSLP
jgi:hypothetical protein